MSYSLDEIRMWSIEHPKLYFDTAYYNIDTNTAGIILFLSGNGLPKTIPASSMPIFSMYGVESKSKFPNIITHMSSSEKRINIL